VTVDAGILDSATGGLRQRSHVVGMALGGVVGIFFLSMQRILANARAEAAADGIKDRDSDAECAEINSCDDTHRETSKKQKPN
jgi:hypothetical protein